MYVHIFAFLLKLTDLVVLQIMKNYDASQEMMPGYRIHWTVNHAGKYIDLALEVQTLGAFCFDIFGFWS